MEKGNIKTRKKKKLERDKKKKTFMYTPTLTSKRKQKDEDDSRKQRFQETSVDVYQCLRIEKKTCIRTINVYEAIILKRMHSPATRIKHQLQVDV